MKKLIVTLLFLFPFITGCSNINANIDFLNSKTVLFSADLFSNKETNTEEVLLIKENYKKFLDPDYVTDVYLSKDSAKISAIKLVKDIKRNDIDLSSIGFKTNLSSGRFIDVKHNIFVTSYNVNLTYDLPAQQSKTTTNILTEHTSPKGLNPEYLQKYGDEDISFDNPEQKTDEDFKDNHDEYIERRDLSKIQQKTEDKDTSLEISNLSPVFSITLPSYASYNNADRQADNVYYWNIKNDEPTNIKMQYVVYNSFAITLLLLAFFALLFLVVRLILKHETQKRIDSNK